MESSIVIKVKYEKTLRRFNANVVDGRLVLDMKALRAKVLSLFNLAPEVEVTLRYTDEDGDVVTLGDEYDLIDVVKQSLNPLRISVKLNTEKTVKKNDTGTSTPIVSPLRSQHVRDNILDFVVRDAAVKVTKAFSSTHKDSPPALNEIVESFMKQVAEIQASAGSIPKIDGASECKPDLKKDTNGASKREVVGPFSSPNSGVNTSKNVSVPSSAYCNKSGMTNVKDQSEKAGVVILPRPKTPEALSNWRPNLVPCLNKEIKSNKYPSGLSNVGPNRVSECPFSGIVIGNDDGYTTSVPQVYAPVHRQPCIVHYGVECDGCGVHPIEGTRFKSIVKHDYDLCGKCFAKEGNEKDYIKIVTPAHLHSWQKTHVPTGGTVMNLKLNSCFIQDVTIPDGTIVSPSTPFTKIWRMKNNGETIWPRGTHIMWIGGNKFSKTASVELKIPSTGLLMEEEHEVAIDFCAPEEPGRYISYWRLASPSGQEFGTTVWVFIQVDAGVSDPVLPKDTQYTRRIFNLNLPPPINTSVSSTLINNANSVEPMVKYKSPNAEPERPNKDEEFLLPLDEVYTIYIDKDEELNFPINDTLLVDNGTLNPSKPALASSSTVSYPVIDLSTIEPVPHITSLASMNSTMPMISAATTTTPIKFDGDAKNENEVEPTLLRELDEMGFTEMDLNKDILRRNEYNLQQSVGDLCGVEGWDPILDELKEMGFCNVEVNKRLLKKNKGSIKRVVMDLINGE